MDDALPEPLTLDDEGRHPPDPEVALWNESWYLDAVTPDGTLGAFLRWSLYPNEDRAWLWACVVGEGRPLTAAVVHDLALPSDARTLGTEQGPHRLAQRVHEPFGEVTVDLATRAERHDDPNGLFEGPGGEPVALSLELTWRPAARPYPYPGMTRYEVPCTVAGWVEVDGERLALEGDGERDHSWGHRDWWAFSWMWTSGRLDDGTFLHGTRPEIPGIEYQPSFVVPPGGSLVEASGFTPEHVLGEHGLPAHTDARLHDLELRVTPRFLAPLRLEATDGRVTRLVRALCRFEDRRDGRAGYGWTEWNQPFAAGEAPAVRPPG